jgi:hypothetical protein
VFTDYSNLASLGKEKMVKIRQGFMFLELLLVLVIIMFIITKGFKFYADNPLIGKEAKSLTKESGIDTTSYKSIIESTKNKVEDIQDKHFEELDKLE